MALLDSGTIMTITGVGLPNWSARGLTQKLTVIEQARQVERDLNGNAMDLSNSIFRKYETSIACRDLNVPAFEDLWPGALVVIECVAEIARHMYQLPVRDVVPGSEREVGEYVLYRPVMQFMITNFNWDTDEWGARVGWTLEATEY